MLTEQDLQRLRAKEKADKIKLKTMLVIVMTMITSSLVFVSADLAGTQIVSDEAPVISLNEHQRKGVLWCSTKLQVSLGLASIEDLGHCSRRSWQVGERMAVAIRVGRLTHSILIMRDYGALATPRYDTLGGLELFPQRDYVKNPPIDVHQPILNSN